jgi:hypothetical protein
MKNNSLPQKLESGPKRGIEGLLDLIHSAAKKTKHNESSLKPDNRSNAPTFKNEEISNMSSTYDVESGASSLGIQPFKPPPLSYNSSGSEDELTSNTYKPLGARSIQPAESTSSKQKETPKTANSLGAASINDDPETSDFDTDDEALRKIVEKPLANSNKNKEKSAAESKKISRRERLKLTQHRSIIKSLKTELRTLRPSLSTEKLEELLDMINALEAKYISATEYKSKRKLKTVTHPATREHFIKRVQGTGTEEIKHPWLPAAEFDPNIPDILMRAWDEISQCQIRDYRVGCLSGSSDCMLDTFARRKLGLTRHSDWGNRFKTPFISTSSSLEEIAEHRVPHFQNRQSKKGIKENTKLTLFNTRARRALGKPVLRMKDELLHYDVRTKYGDLRLYESSFYENEYLLPFSAGPDEIIGTWAWHQVEDWIEKNGSNFQGWFKSVGRAAFDRHEKLRLGGFPIKCKAGCDCCGQ